MSRDDLEAVAGDRDEPDTCSCTCHRCNSGEHARCWQQCDTQSISEISQSGAVRKDAQCETKE
jgi:hypothetical protein